MIRDRLGFSEHIKILRYLEVSIFGGRLRRVDCSLVEWMIQDRLEGWQACTLSMMGMIILVRAVLSSMPIYVLANAILSKSLVIMLE